jgi:hypothetical protein
MVSALIQTTLKLRKLVCLVLVLAVGLAGMRLVLNDLVTPAHIHASTLKPAIGSSTHAHEHHHASVSRHIHDTGFRSFEMVVTSDHETGNDFSAEKSVSKISFDWNFSTSFSLYAINTKHAYDTKASSERASVVSPRLDRPPIFS